MARVLLINTETQGEINAAIERVRARAVPWEKIKDIAIATPTPTLTLDQRPENFEPRQFAEFVRIPQGYLAAISFEEQPAGLCRHLSVSVDTKGRVPNVPAMWMLAEAFGFDMGKRKGPSLIFPRGRVWIEEFEPGHEAVNIVQVCER